MSDAPSSLLLRFDRFMDRALHHPKTGYYARRIQGIGRRGDFTTAPTLSEAPARAIAHWAATALRETGCRHLIEIGPGEGRLAAEVLNHLPWHLRWRIRLHLVETSAPLENLQRQLLGKRATWHRNPAEALAACGGDAVIYSNELVDAFPVRRFQKTADGWQEIYVRFQPTEELLLPCDGIPLSSHFLQPHPIGQRIEVHESYHQWLVDWLPHWRSGRMLTIDYGSTADRLYHRRPQGTVRSYLFQQRLEGLAVYENPGRQDITADVNFTDLIDWTNEGSANHSLRSFEEFIQPFTAHTDRTDQYLTDVTGAGSAFLVLDQSR
jgi:SAM-dependent MidA family methyltransferase